MKVSAMSSLVPCTSCREMMSALSISSRKYLSFSWNLLGSECFTRVMPLQFHVTKQSEGSEGNELP